MKTIWKIFYIILLVSIFVGISMVVKIEHHSSIFFIFGWLSAIIYRILFDNDGTD
jgi:hypothetical protein